MAEIPIERKSGSKSWLWILALVALAALAWMMFSNDADDTETTAPAGEVGAVAPSAGAAPWQAAVGADGGTLRLARAA